jgi:hypothetical protein
VLSGLALEFFAISRVWLYVQMWRVQGAPSVAARVLETDPL